MDRTKQLELFRAQTSNVKELEKAWRITKISINNSLKNSQIIEANVQTKILAIIYSAWTEALFSKLIHTPHGFELSEIAAIKAEDNVKNKWLKCLDLAKNKIDLSASGISSVDFQNIINHTIQLINDYIFVPSQLRNRVAHGQWVTALNGSNTNVSLPLTQALTDLNIVTLDTHKIACLGLAEIIRYIVESPNKSFNSEYARVAARLDNELTKRHSFNMTNHVDRLKIKYNKRQRIQT